MTDSTDRTTLVARIADRFLHVTQPLGVQVERLDIMMDLEIADEALDLDLMAMLTADIGTLLHDIAGIRYHLDRTTGTMKPTTWRPRCLAGKSPPPDLVSEIHEPVLAQPMQAPHVIAAHMASLAALEQESLYVLCLDNKRRLVGQHLVHLGTATKSLVCPRDIYRHAVRDNAVSIVIVHNHPSGDTTPSPEDHNITKRLAEAGRLMGIAVADHIIIGRSEYGCVAHYSYHLSGPVDLTGNGGN